MERGSRTMLLPSGSQVTLVVLALLSLCLGLRSPYTVQASNVEERVCNSVEVKSYAAFHLDYRNCTAILGFLHIVDIKVASPGALSFPLLREVTDYILLFKVWGVDSLSEVFPKLTVVRGQRLFSHFALVVYEVDQLKNLGLQQLGWVGSDVRLTKNPHLCYVDTVSWESLLREGKVTQESNRQPGECPDVCPRECKHCWNATHCQLQLDCQGCGSAGCHKGECCHPECLGGCQGPGPDQCLACRHVRHQGVCLPTCPAHLFMLRETRCVTEGECRAGPGQLKLVRGQGASAGLCVDSCPPGYMLENQSHSECKRCPGDCPKECIGKIVDNLGEAMTLKGCTKILGNLEIQIKNGHMVGRKMEEGLGSIEEITGYLKVVRSDALLSLHFFSKLKVIRGEELSYGSLSLSVHSNINMELLFRDDVTANLSIEAGEVFITNNRMLCVSLVRHLLTAVGKTESEENLRTNGDRAACSVTELKLTVFSVDSTIAVLNWTVYKMQDPRRFISYELFYRQIEGPDAKIDIYEGRDACEEVIWMTKEVEDSNAYVTYLDSLRPWTWYAAFVQTVMMVAPETAISKVLTFRTKPSNPTVPVELKVEAGSESELKVTWSPPLHPNGNVTHYVIFWTPVLHALQDTLRRDACERITTRGRQRRGVAGLEQQSLAVVDGVTCCACPQQKPTVPKTRFSSDDILFNDKLHDILLTKSKKGSGRPDISINKTSHFNVSVHAQTTKSTYVIPEATTSPTSPRPVMPNVTTAPTTAEVNVTANVSQPPNMAVVSDLEFLITGLDHFTTYKVEVMACQDGLNERCSRTNASASERTLPSKVADSVDSSSVVVRRTNHSDQVFVTWRSPQRPNGAVLSYEIQYSRIIKGKVNEERRYGTVCQTQQEFMEKGGYQLTPLEPGDYHVRIRANTLAGNGSFTVPVAFVVTSPPGDETMTVAAKTGIIVLVLLVVIFFVVGGAFLCYKRHQDKFKVYNISHNPCYVSSSQIYERDDEWEVPRENIKLLCELGKGSFGKVYEGMASEIRGERDVRVAVKTVNDRFGLQATRNALKEATVMKDVKTTHVVGLKGIVSIGEPTFIIMELMPRGDLKNYLRSRRPERQEPGGLGPPTLIEVLHMACQIADGLAYLGQRKYIHRDLAARNCMVAENGMVKVGDFGMARDVYEGDYYRKGGKDKLPVRWMAPESLTDGVCTSKSDVWSYGVVIWEIVTLAEQPYQGFSNEQVIQFVKEGGVMDSPFGCPMKLYILMRMCWRLNDQERVSFEKILKLLRNYMPEYFKNDSYYYSKEGQHALEEKRRKREESDDDELTLDDLELDLMRLYYLGEDEIMQCEEVSSHSGEDDELNRAVCPPYAPSSGDGTSEEGERYGEADTADDDEAVHSDECDDCRTPFLRGHYEGKEGSGIAPTPTPSPCSKRAVGESGQQHSCEGVQDCIKHYDAIIMKPLHNGHCSPTLTAV